MDTASNQTVNMAEAIEAHKKKKDSKKKRSGSFTLRRVGRSIGQSLTGAFNYVADMSPRKIVTAPINAVQDANHAVQSKRTRKAVRKAMDTLANSPEDIVQEEMIAQIAEELENQQTS